MAGVKGAMRLTLMAMLFAFLFHVQMCGCEQESVKIEQNHSSLRQRSGHFSFTGHQADNVDNNRQDNGDPDIKEVYVNKQLYNQHIWLTKRHDGTGRLRRSLNGHPVANGTNSQPGQSVASGTNSQPKQSVASGTNSQPEQSVASVTISLPEQSVVTGTNTLPETSVASGTNSVPEQSVVTGTNTLPETSVASGTISLPEQSVASGTNSVPEQSVVTGTNTLPETSVANGTNTLPEQDENTEHTNNNLRNGESIDTTSLTTRRYSDESLSNTQKAYSDGIPATHLDLNNHNRTVQVGFTSQTTEYLVTTSADKEPSTISNVITTAAKTTERDTVTTPETFAAKTTEFPTVTTTSEFKPSFSTAVFPTITATTQVATVTTTSEFKPSFSTAVFPTITATTKVATVTTSEIIPSFSTAALPPVTTREIVTGPSTAVLPTDTATTELAITELISSKKLSTAITSTEKLTAFTEVQVNTIPASISTNTTIELSTDTNTAVQHATKTREELASSTIIIDPSSTDAIFRQSPMAERARRTNDYDTINVSYTDGVTFDHASYTSTEVSYQLHDASQKLTTVLSSSTAYVGRQSIEVHNVHFLTTHTLQTGLTRDFDSHITSAYPTASQYTTAGVEQLSNATVFGSSSASTDMSVTSSDVGADWKSYHFGSRGSTTLQDNRVTKESVLYSSLSTDDYSSYFIHSNKSLHTHSPDRSTLFNNVFDLNSTSVKITDTSMVNTETSTCPTCTPLFETQSFAKFITATSNEFESTVQPESGIQTKSHYTTVKEGEETSHGDELTISEVRASLSHFTTKPHQIERSELPIASSLETSANVHDSMDSQSQGVSFSARSSKTHHLSDITSQLSSGLESQFSTAKLQSINTMLFTSADDAIQSSYFTNILQTVETFLSVSEKTDHTSSPLTDGHVSLDSNRHITPSVSLSELSMSANILTFTRIFISSEASIAARSFSETEYSPRETFNSISLSSEHLITVTTAMRESNVLSQSEALVTLTTASIKTDPFTEVHEAHPAKNLTFQPMDVSPAPLSDPIKRISSTLTVSQPLWTDEPPKSYTYNYTSTVSSLDNQNDPNTSNTSSSLSSLTILFTFTSSDCTSMTRPPYIEELKLRFHVFLVSLLRNINPKLISIEDPHCAPNTIVVHFKYSKNSSQVESFENFMSERFERFYVNIGPESNVIAFNITNWEIVDQPVTKSSGAGEVAVITTAVCVCVALVTAGVVIIIKEFFHKKLNKRLSFVESPNFSLKSASNPRAQMQLSMYTNLEMTEKESVDDSYCDHDETEYSNIDSVNHTSFNTSASCGSSPCPEFLDKATATEDELLVGTPRSSRRSRYSRNKQTQSTSSPSHGRYGFVVGLLGYKKKHESQKSATNNSTVPQKFLNSAEVRGVSPKKYPAPPPPITEGEASGVRVNGQERDRDYLVLKPRHVKYNDDMRHPTGHSKDVRKKRKKDSNEKMISFTQVIRGNESIDRVRNVGSDNPVFIPEKDDASSDSSFHF